MYLARSASRSGRRDGLKFHVLRTYRRAARGKGNAHVNAMLGPLQQLAHCLRKSQRNCHRAHQSPARRHPRASKIEPRATKIKPGSAHASPVATKRASRVSNKRTRDSQEWPRSAQKRKLAPSWRPKTLQNRGQDAKKSMSKKDALFASIFQ